MTGGRCAARNIRESRPADTIKDCAFLHDLYGAGYRGSAVDSCVYTQEKGEEEMKYYQHTITVNKLAPTPYDYYLDKSEDGTYVYVFFSECVKDRFISRMKNEGIKIISEKKDEYEPGHGYENLTGGIADPEILEPDIKNP
jgi:hypothetical protein